MATDDENASTDDWPDLTLIVRGGAVGAFELAQRRSKDGSWSVVAAPGLRLEALARSVPHHWLRVTTLGRLRSAGGWLLITPGPPNHCDLGGLTAIRLDAILGQPRQNPVPRSERWKP